MNRYDTKQWADILTMFSFLTKIYDRPKWFYEREIEALRWQYEKYCDYLDATYDSEAGNLGCWTFTEFLKQETKR